MREPETFAIASDLAAPAARVWADVTRPEGVNDELMPLLRMTFPGAPEGFTLDGAPTDRVLCHCWLLAFGVLPYDRHALKLARVEPGRGFVEASTSWTQRLWRHERSIEPLGASSCRVRDALTFAPRMPLPRRVVRSAVEVVFVHRHGRLRRRYGESGASA
ncbi:MAG TPA: hypothetical protein VFS43_42955 [Polyangiaceae bacterium]|nr:hypothetical protein [Polyangiaceae bacterium]